MISQLQKESPNITSKATSPQVFRNTLTFVACPNLKGCPSLTHCSYIRCKREQTFQSSLASKITTVSKPCRKIARSSSSTPSKNPCEPPKTLPRTSKSSGEALKRFHDASKCVSNTSLRCQKLPNKFTRDFKTPNNKET